MAKTCGICQQLGKTRWCAGCAKDTCQGCWPKHVHGCFNLQKNKCHQCGKKIRKVKSVEDMEGIVMQSFTGRTFCDSDCFDEYRENEGL